MKVDNQNIRPIWLHPVDESIVNVIDQRRLPHEFVVLDLKTTDDVISAIREMIVRGAPLIGATGAYGVYLSTLSLSEYVMNDNILSFECERLKSSRPTAVNLSWAVDITLKEVLKGKTPLERVKISKHKAHEITEFEAGNCKRIGEFGLDIVKEISERKKGKTVNILTHCNARWLACVDYGTATAPMYAAHDAGIDAPCRRILP